MQVSVDLAKLVGITGEAIIVPGDASARFTQQQESTWIRLHDADAELDAEDDEAIGGYHFLVSQLFRRSDG